MSLTVERPAPAVPGRLVARQLARVEARRLMTHPAVVIGTLLASWAMWELNTGAAPVLNRAGANTALPLALIAGGGVLAAADVSLRMWRSEQSEAFDITPASHRTRAVALLFATLGPVLLALVVQTVALTGLMLDSPVTALDWWDAVSGPLAVGLASVIGMAAGRWAPSRVTGAVSLVVLAAITISLSSYGILQRAGQGARWLAPMVALEFDPYELSFRPTAAHATYLAGLIGVFVCVALLRGRSTPALPALAGVAFLILAGVAGSAQFRAAEDFDFAARQAALVPPGATYACETVDTVEYCALPGYEPWIEEWRALVAPVVTLAPERVASRPLRVTQYPTQALDILFSGPDRVTPLPGLATGMWWGRGPGGTGWGGAWPFGMALGTASWAVGLPLELTEGHWVTEYDDAGEIESSEFVAGTEGVPAEDVDRIVCSTLNQGRAMVALWMAAQASPVTEQHLRNVIEHPDQPIFEEWVNEQGETVILYTGVASSIEVGQPYPWYALEFSNHEAYYAYQLLDLPDEQVHQAVLDNWAFLTDPGTDTREALAVFGLEPITGYDDYFPDEYTFYPVCD